MLYGRVRAWLPDRRSIFHYEGRDKIVPECEGEGHIDGRTDGEGGPGIDEWHAHLKDDEVQFTLIKFIMGDRESKRPKFILVTWIGPSVGVMKKAKVSIHKSSVKDFVGVRTPCSLAHTRSGLCVLLVVVVVCGVCNCEHLGLGLGLGRAAGWCRFVCAPGPGSAAG